jgi:hypothetical protein
MTEIIGEELAHAAYRRDRRAGLDEVDGFIGWRFFELEVVEEVLTGAFPFCSVAGMTLRIDRLAELIANCCYASEKVR